MKLHLPTFLFQIVNFAVLLLILHRVLYRPLRHAIEGRRQAVSAELAAAARTREEALALQKKAQDELAGVDRERTARLDALRGELDRERAALLQQAREEAEGVRAREASLLAAARRDRERELEERARETVVRYARQLLGDVSDEELHRNLLRRFLAEAPRAAGEIAAAAGGAEGPEVVLAYPPGEEDLAALRAALPAGPGGEPPRTRLDRSLIAGARLEAGGRIYDASLAGQIAALAARLRGAEGAPGGKTRADG